jgi:outer membrane protein TolC
MTNVLRTAKGLVFGAATVLAAATSAVAQQAPPAPAAPPPQPPQPVAPYVVGQARPPAVQGSALVDMSLEQAMQVALEKNLDLKAARLTPQGVDYQLQAARAAFNPRITGTYGYNNNTRPVNSTVLDPNLTSLNTITQTFNSGMTQVLPWNGSSVGVSFNNNRQATNSSQTPVNPSYNANLQANFSMPLLAGFKIDQSRNTLKTTAIQRQVADIQLQQTIENTKASVRTAYWNLRQAIEQIEIQQRGLDLANRLYQDNRVKVEIGTLAPIDTVQSEAQVASAEQGLLNAQVAWQTAELALKRLLADGPEDQLYRATINPTEQAAVAAQSVDIPAAVRTAMDQRTDLTQSRKNIEIAQLNLELSKNQTKPDLAFNTSYSLAGQGGQRLVQGVKQPGGYTDALEQLRAIVNPTWNMNFQFAYPLGMAAAKANYARALLQFDQSHVNLQAQELQVSADVTNAGLAVENTYKQFQAAQKNREAQERNAEAEQTRFDVGMSTNFNVVSALNTLTTARLNELRAIINYLNAIAEFDRIQRVGGR